MELDIRISQATVDIAVIEQRLQQADPACVLDLDPANGHLRVSTCASPDEVLQALVASGHPVSAKDVTQVPSVCCGGCSG